MAHELSGTGLYLDGKWRGRLDSGLDVHNPATGHWGGSVVAATAGEVTEAIASAAGAFREWSSLAPDQRAAFLRSAYEVILGWVQAPFGGIKGSGAGKAVGGGWRSSSMSNTSASTSDDLRIPALEPVEPRPLVREAR
jgi:acyl-CoA reductase-like NAD-dependent aldehyde dehydrogenase